MAEKESRIVSTLNEFLEWAAQFNDGQYLFRGVKDEIYKIEASASRRLPQEHRDNPSRLFRITKRLIEDARSRGHDQKDGRTLSHLELLAELQHIGAATCLIDFTRSALVALWFACENGTEDENAANGRVYAVGRDIRLKTVTSDLIQKPIDHFFHVDSENSYQLYQWEPKLQNNRIIAQHSVFVFGGAEIEVEAECVIQSDCKRSISESLKYVSDITEATMYPDFYGFAQLRAQNRPYTEPDAHTYLQRGIEAYQRDNLGDAVDYFTEVILSVVADTTVTARAYNNRGVAYNKKGEYDLAIADFTEMMALRRNDPQAHRNRGATRANHGEYELAIKDFDKAIDLNPEDARVYNMRGKAYSAIRNYESAAADHIKALELQPNDFAGYFGLGLADFGKKDFSSAVANYRQAILLNPASAEAYGNRGEAWLHLGEWEKARSDLLIAKEKGVDIIASFRNDYENAEDFEQKSNVKLPDDIVAMLTPTVA